MRKRNAQNKGGRRGSNSNDFISKMPDEVLLIILSLMPLKDAVGTCSLSKRWKFLCSYLIHLNFDGGVRIDNMALIQQDLERLKYVNQVNSVIKRHKGPMVQEFRIRFDLDDRYKRHIDYWLQFCINKKVEILELDLINNHMIHTDLECYEFPLQLSTAEATIMQPLYLKKLILKLVKVRDAVLQEILTNSPHLETLCIHDPQYLTRIVIGGEAIKLKHFEIGCSFVESIHLYEFGLVSFSYKGPAIDLRLVDLPKLKELDIGQGVTGLEDNILGQIATSLSCIQVLALYIYLPHQSLALNDIPELPNVKKLRLRFGAFDDDSLLGFTSIPNACPNLETFTIELLWCSPIRRRRKVRHVGTPTRPLKHLRQFEVKGYYGRISDLELVVYIIENAVALEQIMIDPCCGNPKIAETARSYAQGQLKSVTPQGVKLAIL